MSLSTWFRDYVYIPLGGNRVKKSRWLLNILIVWILTGLWHGAAWNFILWGLFYGLILIFEKLIFNKVLEKLPKFVRWLYSFVIIMFGWMLFRANNLHDIILLTKKMFTYTTTDWIAIISSNVSNFNSLLFVLPAFVLSFPIIKKLNDKFENNNMYNIITNVVLLGLLILCIVYLTSSNYNPFIYFRF